MKRMVALALACAMCALCLVGCGGKTDTPPQGNSGTTSQGNSGTTSTPAVKQKDSFTMYTCYVEAEVAALVDAFTQETGIKVNYVRLSAGEMQARVEAEKENPQVSMIFGMGTDLAMAMDDSGLLDPFFPSNIDEIYPEYADPKGIYVPLHMICTCFGSNTQWLAEHNLEAPTSWEDLLKDEFKDALCWAHPATSGAAYTGLATIIQYYGEEAGFEYLKKLDKNINVYTKAGAAPFTACGLGECGVAIGYSDNAQTVVDQGYPLVITYMEEGAGYGITCASMVKGGPADEQDAAHAFIEWLIGENAMSIASSEFNQYPLNKTVQADPKMTPLDDIAKIDFDAKWSAENKKSICEKFESEVRSSSDVVS